MKLKEFKEILALRPKDRLFVEHRGFFDKNQIWYGSLWPSSEGKNRYESIHFTLLPSAYLSAGGSCSIGCLGELFDMKSLSFISKESYDEKIQSIKQLLDEGKFCISLRSGKRLDITSKSEMLRLTESQYRLSSDDVRFLQSQF